MTAPTWPRLASRALRARASTAQGRWRTHGATGTFVHRAPDDWVTLDASGRRSDGLDVRHLLRPHFQRGDYCTAAGPVRGVEHDGRPAWEVDLLPPPHKQGLLRVTVDDATGLLVKQENTTGRHLFELLDLVVDEPVDEAVFSARGEQDLASAREAALYDLAHRRPVPTPQWFPWRRGWFDAPELRVVETDRGVGSVGRAPRGQEAPTTDWTAHASVHRLDHRGWSWAVSSEPPMSALDARRVVEEVVDLDRRSVPY